MFYYEITSMIESLKVWNTTFLMTILPSWLMPSSPHMPPWLSSVSSNGLHTSLSLSVASLRFLRRMLRLLRIIHEHVPLQPHDDRLHEECVDDKLAKEQQSSHNEIDHNAVHHSIRHDNCVSWSPVCTLLISFVWNHPRDPTHRHNQPPQYLGRNKTLPTNY